MKNLLSFLLFVPTFLLAQVAPDYSELKTEIDTILSKNKIPGAQLVIVSADTILWKQNFGYADEKEKKPVTNETMFRIGSVTKSFVAISALQMVEQGQLSLEAKVKDLAPEIPFSNPWAATHPLKVAHLLEHTTGWDDMHMKEYATNGDGWTTLQGLQFHADSKTSRWAPGQHFSYCNSGPPAAAFIIEKITGETIEDYIEANVFKSLGMEHSSLLKTNYVDQHLSKGYYGEHNTEADYWHIIDRAAGSINSTASEMANYLQMYLNRGSKDSLRILKPISIARMERPLTTLAAKAGAKEGYGLHIQCKEYKGTKICGHSGGMAGFLTMMNYMPEKGIGYFYSINKNGAGFRDIDYAVLDFLLDRDSSWTAPKAKTSGYDQSVIGYYRSATSRNQMIRALDWLPNLMRIFERNDTLFRKELMGGSESVLYVEGPKTFRNYSKSGIATMVQFSEDIDGRTILQAPAFGENFYRTSGFAAWGGIFAFAISLLLVVTNFIIALVWIPMWLFGKKNIRFKRARAFPLLWGLSFIGLFFIFVASQEVGDVLENLGNPSVWSIGIFIGGILLAIFGAISGITAFQSLNKDVNHAARVHSILVSIGILFITGYLAYFGMIGLRTWVY